MSDEPHGPDAANPTRPRAPWHRPVLTPLGNVKDLIRGGPKTGGTADGDHGQRKDPAIG